MATVVGILMKSLPREILNPITKSEENLEYRIDYSLWNDYSL